VLSLAPTTRVFVAHGATDLRRSFDRLAAMATEVLGQDPFSGHLFVYFNRRRDRVKLLFWERGGFWLLCKRLETGTFAEAARRELSPRDLFLLLEGLEVVRERPRYTPRAG
jgi:transposase